MNTSASGIHPQQMLKAELIPEGTIEDLDCGGNEAPAVVADALAGAAGTDLVIVGHVDIENKFALYWL